MSKICYKYTRFQRDSLELIDYCNTILESYVTMGYDMTLRQLYYQMVSQDIIPNTQKSYSKLGNLVNDARLAGMIDWDHLVDRTRNLQSLSHFEDATDILNAAAQQFRLDKWKTQFYRVECWSEKEALAGVFERVCQAHDVPYFSCRGYVSQSEMWRAAMRLKAYEDQGYDVTILHFGDHDPSGTDMTRDIQDRLEMFLGYSIDVQRLALNMDQIQQYNPPPNPTKISDSRAVKYIDTYGHDSWELDALPPDVLSALVEQAIVRIRIPHAWDAMVDQENLYKKTLHTFAHNYTEVEAFVRNTGLLGE